MILKFQMIYSKVVNLLILDMLRHWKNKEDQVVDNKSLERKLIQEETTEIKRTKMLVEEWIKAMDGDVENLCVQTDKEGDLALLSKSNAFRRVLKEKKENVHVINKALLELQDKLKIF